MIDRAIGELNEPEGCTEESISKFIRRSYDDLPWSHSTLLNHHLQKLCECGEIVVKGHNRYLHPDGNTNLNATPCSTPERELIQGTQRRRGKKVSKLRAKKLSGRAWHTRKNQTKEKTQNGEQMVMIHGQEQLQECHNLFIEDRNLAEEPHTKTIEEPHELQARDQEQQIVSSGDQNLLEGRTMDSDHLELNQMEVLSPERPPGFDAETVKELAGLQQQQRPEESLQICSKQVQMDQQHGHRPPGLAADLRLVEQERQPDFSNSEGPLGLYAQEKACKSLDGLQLLKSVERLPEMQQQQGKQRVRKRHAKSRPEVVITEDVPTNSNQHSEIPKAGKSLVSKLATVVQSPEEKLQRGKVSLRQKASKSELPTMRVSLNLPKEPDSKRKRTRSKSKTLGTEDASMHSEHIAQLPNPEERHGPETRLVEPCPKEEVQCVKRRKGCKEPQYILALEAVAAGLGLPKKSKKQPEKSSQAERRGWRGWGQKTSPSTPPMTSKTELFSSSEVQHQETGLPNQKCPPKPKQTQVEESTQTTEQQAENYCQEKQDKSHPMVISNLNVPTDPQFSNLDIPTDPQQLKLSSTEGAQKVQHQTQESSWRGQLRPRPPNSQHLKSTTMGQHQNVIEQEQKKPSEEQSTQHELQQQEVIGQKNLPLSKPKTRRCSLDSRLASQMEPEQPQVCLNSERAKEKHYQLAHENSQNLHLRPRHPKSKAAKATTASELVPSQYLNEQQQGCQYLGRPLKRKLDTDRAILEPSQSYPQDQHEEKPGAPRGRGRPRKCLHNPQQQEKQTKCRGQGRNPKRKPDDATMEKPVQEPKRRGPGRPRKLDK